MISYVGRPWRRLEMCRCPARAVEAAAGSLRGLRALAALAIRDAALDPAPLARAAQLRELRLKSMAGLALTADLTHLERLTHLHHLSLTSIKVGHLRPPRPAAAATRSLSRRSWAGARAT